MIRRLIAYLRGTRQPTTAPSEPHSHGSFDSEPTAFGRSRTTHGTPLTAEPTAFDRLILGPDDGAAPGAVPVPPVRHEDLDDATAMDLHRPDTERRGWRFWRRAELDEPTREWLADMKAPEQTMEDRARDLIQRKEDRDWDAAWFRLRWVLTEAGAEMRAAVVAHQREHKCGPEVPA